MGVANILVSSSLTSFRGSIGSFMANACDIYISSQVCLDNIRLFLWLAHHRTNQNTFEYNFGIKEEHNKLLKQLIGKSAFTQLDIEYDTAGVRLLEYTPGNGIPLHTDSYNAFRDKNNLPADKGSVHRYFVAVSPWSWGHMLQVHDNVIANWSPGYVVEIPQGVFHLSTNFGIETKLSLTITGFRR